MSRIRRLRQPGLRLVAGVRQVVRVRSPATRPEPVRGRRPEGRRPEISQPNTRWPDPPVRSAGRPKWTPIAYTGHESLKRHCDELA